MGRAAGPSVRLKLTLSYAGFLLVASSLLLGAMWLFVLRYLEPNLVFRTLNWLPFTRADPLHGFAVPAVMLLVLLLLFGLVGGWFLSGRMLAPLAEITAATRLASTGALEHRVALEGRADEFTELADAFDAMLAQLQEHVARQRRFAANASHELRTPLAITQSLLDAARADPEADQLAVLERLHTVNARAVRLTEALLLLSRADGGAVGREAVDLSLVADEAAETLLPLAERLGVGLEIVSCPTATVGSQALLLQLTMTLVHNAIVHNHAERGTVWISTETAGGRAVLAVENTGVPLDATRLATLAEPFVRGAQRVHDDHAGVGLGLAIAKAITDAHGGSLTLLVRAGGGLRVEVLLKA